MRNSTAYFAGVATVFAATALGFSGAMIFTGATASRSPAEPTRLERHVAAASAPISPAPDAKPVATNDPGPPQGRDQPPPAAAQPQQSAQQSTPDSATPQTAPPAQTPAQAPPRTAVAEPDQSMAASEAQSPADAYARSSDRDIQKYIHKRDRRWARRHYRDDEVATAPASVPSDQSASQSSMAGASSQQGQPQAAQPNVTPIDQAAGEVDITKVRRKHDRHSTRGYARNDSDGFRGEGRGQPLDVRESPRDDAPPLFAMPRWRPFFSDNDDD